MCVCVCMCVYIYIYIYSGYFKRRSLFIQTRTHAHAQTDDISIGAHVFKSNKTNDIHVVNKMFLICTMAPF